MYNFNCQFRESDNSPCICKYQSLKLGHIVKTSSLFCNHECPKNVYEQGEEDKEFLIKCFNRRYNHEFINKVINKFAKQTKLIVPSIWPEVFRTLYDILSQELWFDDIGLTGSIIVDGVDNQKDIDIVIGIKDINEYIQWSKNNSLPNYINNIKTDYYLYATPMDQAKETICGSFFLSLWPNKKIIYTNELFKKNIIFPNDYQVFYNNIIDQLFYNIGK